jgi:hypothetical protein
MDPSQINNEDLEEITMLRRMRKENKLTKNKNPY